MSNVNIKLILINLFKFAFAKHRIVIIIYLRHVSNVLVSLGIVFFHRTDERAGEKSMNAWTMGSIH